MPGSMPGCTISAESTDEWNDFKSFAGFSRASAYDGRDESARGTRLWDYRDGFKPLARLPWCEPASNVARATRATRTTRASSATSKLHDEQSPAKCGSWSAAEPASNVARATRATRTTRASSATSKLHDVWSNAKSTLHGFRPTDPTTSSASWAWAMGTCYDEFWNAPEPITRLPMSRSSGPTDEWKRLPRHICRRAACCSD